MSIPPWMIEQLEEERIWREMHEQSEQLYDQLRLPLYDELPPSQSQKPCETSGSRVIVIEL